MEEPNLPKEKKIRIPKGRRFQVLRVDALVGNAERKIEKTFDLPKGCVQLNLPNGKKARKDKLIRSLLKDYKNI